jgi:ADP-L-glycero-D-manno-heptose 6-epimerase
MGAISATTAIDGDEIVRTNFDLSRQLWDYCTKHQVPFVYASSAATYGDGSQGFDDNNDLAVMQALRPLNLYGWSKQWFDIWVLRQVDKGRLTPPRWAGLKFFNVYGPRELHKEDMMSIVSKYHARCAVGAPVKLFKSHNPDYEDGGQLRDFVYVRDCVDVVSWLLEDKGPSGIFNVGSGDARSFKDLVGAAYVAAGHKPEITYVDMPETLRGRYQYFTRANLDNLRKAGYTQPMTKLEDGVTDLMRSYLMTEHPQG